LGKTPYAEGFHFNTAIGEYTQKTATSLAEFAEILKTIDERSIAFHFHRQDFQKWMKNTLGDSELADRIAKVDSKAGTENVRNSLVEIVKNRIIEIQKIAIQH
jgi:hypothetical protein